MRIMLHLVTTLMPLLFSYQFLKAEIIFSNVTDSCGLGDFHQNGYGVAMLDYDRDGFQDIFVVGQNGQNKMFHNISGLSYEDVTAQLGIQGSGSGWGVCFGDYDSDYDEDVYVSKRDGGHNDLFDFENNHFDECSSELQVGDPGGYGYAACFAPLTKSLALDLIVVNQAWSGQRQSCRFFGGNVGLPFTDLTVPSGIADSSQYWDCVSSADYDNDNHLDILVSGESTNRLYRNSSRGIFINVSDSSNINIPRDADTTGYGITWGDYNNDGLFDYYISFWHEQNGELYRNNGDGTFSDVTYGLGLGYEEWGHSVSFGDFDNDGWSDIYSVSAGAGNKLYKNNNGISFTEISNQAGVVDGNYGCGLSVGDLDRDGKLDMVVGHYFGNVDKVFLFKNVTQNSNNWIEVRVNGFPPNPDAIGARVRLFSGGMAQIREVSGGSGFGSQNMLPLHFGIGSAVIIDSLIITYPMAPILPIKYFNLAPNQIYELPEIVIDIASIRTLSPLEYQDFETPVLPIFKIANFSNVDITNFEYRCELLYGSIRVAIDSVEIPYIPQGDSMIIEFSPYSLPENGLLYTFEGIALLHGDNNRSNDTIATTFYTGYSHDIAADQIVRPNQDSVLLPIIPEVVIYNPGINNETNFYVDCQVSIHDSIVYIDSILYTDILHCSEYDTLTFQGFMPVNDGMHHFKFNSFLANDRYPANDSSIAEIFIDLGSCFYLPGDVNNSGVANGQDVIFSVRYFLGRVTPSYICNCPLHGEIYITGDVNGSCSFDGSDVIYLVNYFLGGPELLTCPYCPPRNPGNLLDGKTPALR